MVFGFLLYFSFFRFILNENGEIISMIVGENLVRIDLNICLFSVVD